MAVSGFLIEFRNYQLVYIADFQIRHILSLLTEIPHAGAGIGFLLRNADRKGIRENCPQILWGARQSLAFSWGQKQAIEHNLNT